MYKHPAVLSSLVIVTAFAGCVEVRYQPNPQFCTNARGDETCAERFPDGSRPYCVVSECLDDFYGCFPDVPGENCASPCGLENPECEAGGTTEGSSSGSGSSSEDSGSGSESSSTTGPQPCTENGDCTDAGAPFCEPGSGECVGCDGMDDPDGACAGLDPGMPLCVGGACVQCTAAAPEACAGATPVCDDASNTCVPCTAHEQCGEAACNLFTGECLPGDAVVHVGPGQEFGTLTAAVGSFVAGTQGTIVVHQPVADYNESVTVDGGGVLAFLRADDATMPPGWIRSAGGAPQLEVADGTVLLDGLRLSGNADDHGLVVAGGRVWVDRGRIITNGGGGILAQTGAELVLRNCFVGGAVSDVDAVAVNASTLSALYTTFGGGPILGGRARALYCEGASIADVRNSILVSADAMPEVECAGAVLTNSATEDDVGMLNIMWFMSYATGNFSLSGSGATTFADIAQWSTGDPPTDIEGDPRPAVDGTPDYAGADVP
ncbi:hypothetical protein [Paraliomyxa miuraensis]|uniref:hypothetical protein n=1 Tax=Paraliomyxa miuraensis TaxID=376150 RepID=UPI0022566440|nr:hypothetical protein [Paraliomyxa miuraensis]MCX4239734.1 hypothetical protein [Paraliomyxa miuraensis]